MLKLSAGTRLAALGFAAALILTAGCARTVQDVTGPSNGTISDLELDPQAIVFGSGSAGDHGPALFYPLDVGNHWSYQATFVNTVIDSAGTGFSEVFHSTGEHVLQCSSASGEFTYVAEHQTSTGDHGKSDNWIVYRQDGRGLYELDGAGPPFTCGVTAGGFSAGGPAAAEEPLLAQAERGWASRKPSVSAAREMWLQREWTRQIQLHRQIRAELGLAPGVRPPIGPGGGVRPGEITRLRYPMRLGQSWTIRDSPLFASRVVARQAVRTPAGTVGAYKIQITSELFGPDDRVYLWYGQVGYVGLIAQVRSETVDPLGNITTMVTQEQELLTDFQIQPRAIPN